MIGSVDRVYIPWQSLRTPLTSSPDRVSVEKVSGPVRVVDTTPSWLPIVTNSNKVFDDEAGGGYRGRVERTVRGGVMNHRASSP